MTCGVKEPRETPDSKETGCVKKTTPCMTMDVANRKCLHKKKVKVFSRRFGQLQKRLRARAQVGDSPCALAFLGLNATHENIIPETQLRRWIRNQPECHGRSRSGYRSPAIRQCQCQAGERP